MLNGKRHDYFKGSGAVKALLSPAYKKASGGKNSELPKIESEEQAAEVLHSVIPYTFFLRVDRADVSSKEGRPLQINQMQMFKPELVRRETLPNGPKQKLTRFFLSQKYYAWFYEGSQLMLQLSGFGMILLMLAGVMFPLWPTSMRVGVWYLSIGMLGLIGAFFGMAIVRLIVWCITVVVLKPGIWIFPNLFEDVGFVDSFIPLWAWDVPPPKKKAKNVEGNANASNGAGTQKPMANLPGQNDVRPQAPNLPRAAAETKPTTPKKQAASGTQQRLPEQANASEEARQSDNLEGLD